MSLHNHEDHEQPAGPFEVGMLTDELAQVIRNNVGACAIRMPEDFSRRTDVILAGKIDDRGQPVEVVVTQRATVDYLSLKAPQDEEVAYLVQYRRGGERSMCVIAEGRARNVGLGMHALTEDDIFCYRIALNPSVVQWDAQAATQEASSVDPYMWVQHFDRAA